MVQDSEELVFGDVALFCLIEIFEMWLYEDSLVLDVLVEDVKNLS